MIISNTGFLSGYNIDLFCLSSLKAKKVTQVTQIELSQSKKAFQFPQIGAKALYPSLKHIKYLTSSYIKALKKRNT
jgi:hypothetical protein